MVVQKSCAVSLQLKWSVGSMRWDLSEHVVGLLQVFQLVHQLFLKEKNGYIIISSKLSLYHTSLSSMPHPLIPPYPFFMPHPLVLFLHVSTCPWSPLHTTYPWSSPFFTPHPPSHPVYTTALPTFSLDFSWNPLRTSSLTFNLCSSSLISFSKLELQESKR